MKKSRNKCFNCKKEAILDESGEDPLPLLIERGMNIPGNLKRVDPEDSAAQRARLLG